MPNQLNKNKNKLKEKDEIRTAQGHLILAQQAERRRRFQRIANGNRSAEELLETRQRVELVEEAREAFLNLCSPREENSNGRASACTTQSAEGARAWSELFVQDTLPWETTSEDPSSPRFAVVETVGVGEQIAGVGVQIAGGGEQIVGVGVQTAGGGEQIASVGVQTASVGEQIAGVGVQTASVGEQIAGVGVQTAGVGEQIAGVGVQTAGVGVQIVGAGMQTAGVGVQSHGVGVNNASVTGPSNACLPNLVVMAGPKEKLPKFDGDGTADPIRHCKICETI